MCLYGAHVDGKRKDIDDRGGRRVRGLMTLINNKDLSVATAYALFKSLMLITPAQRGRFAEWPARTTTGGLRGQVHFMPTQPRHSSILNELKNDEGPKFKNAIF